MTEEPAELRERASLERMFEARSVAVVGASVKAGSLGHQMMVELARGGYGGAIYPVNPRYDEVADHRCYPSIGEVPEPVDLAILGVANERIESSLADAVAAGAGSAVTFSSLHEEAPPEPGMPPLTERVGRIARSAGMALCGGNGMGFLQLESGLRATGFPTPDVVRPGPVALVSHSGSAFAAFVFNDRQIGFNVVVSSGQEAVTTMADYMAYALSLGSTRVLALLLETVRDPAAFREALAAAADRGIAVLALKMGRTQGSKELVAAHSGALAGEHGAYEAVFDAYGVHECRTFDEMADALELFSSPRRAGSGRGIASVHDSGGERALFVDVAHDLGIPFAAISPATLARIDGVLDPGLVAGNPLDAWGTGIDSERIFRESLLALAEDPDTAALAFVVDMTSQEEPEDAGYLGIARETWSATAVPFCVLSNLSSAVARDEAAVLRRQGLPVLEGTETGLRALGHLLAHRDGQARPKVQPSEPVPAEVRSHWRRRLASGEPLAEIDGLALLEAYGVPVAAARRVSTRTEALDAAEACGYPVALKTAGPGIHHKSDVGGVVLDLAGPGALGAAYEGLAARLGPEAVVATMAPAGVEMALGIVRDPTFGPLVLVAAGGIWVELLHDRRLALPPLDADGAEALLDRLAVRPVLDGMRGSEPADVSGLADAIVRLSVLAADLGDLIEALDVNPMICAPGGCVAVDALVVPAASFWSSSN